MHYFLSVITSLSFLNATTKNSETYTACNSPLSRFSRFKIFFFYKECPKVNVSSTLIFYVSGHPFSSSGRTIDTDFLGPLETTTVALTVSCTRGTATAWYVCAVGECGTATGATIVISVFGDGSLRGVYGATTGGRSYLAVADFKEDVSSAGLVLSMLGGGVGVLDRGKLATSLLTERDRMDPKVWSGDKLAPTDGTMPLMEPDVTRNGSGVGQGEAGVLLTELRVLDSVLCGHCGGPPNEPGLAVPPRLQHSAHCDTCFPFMPMDLEPVMGLSG